MRTVSLIAGVFLILLPVSWLKLIVTGQIPRDGPSVSVALVASLVLFAVSAAMIRYGWRSDARTTVAPSVTNSKSNLTGSGQAMEPPSFFKQVVDALLKPSREAAARRQADKARLLAELEYARTGDLSPIDPGYVVLKGNEKAFASIGASLMEMRTLGYRGGSTGVSVRVAKGVWLRQSGSRGTAQRGLVATSTGILVTTDRRIVFTGSEKSTAVPFEKIAFFEPLLDGLRFSNGTKTFTFFLTGTSHSQQLFLTITQRLLRERNSS